MDAYQAISKRPFLAHLFRSLPNAICSPLNFADEENKMADEILTRTRYGEAFWRAHQEAWRRSELNQREYCEAQGIPLKAFGNWRAKFKAEPQPRHASLLYRRDGLSHTLSHSPSHALSHVTYPSRGRKAPLFRRPAMVIGAGSANRTNARFSKRRRSETRALQREPCQDRAPLWHRSTGSMPMEAGIDAAGVPRGADHRCGYAVRCGAADVECVP